MKYNATNDVTLTNTRFGDCNFAKRFNEIVLYLIDERLIELFLTPISLEDYGIEATVPIGLTPSANPPFRRSAL